jgi:hypothetical protein
MMPESLEQKIQKEIRRRVFKYADLNEQKENILLQTRYTLDALEEITGLPRSMIEMIAKEVRESFGQDKRKFFSIRNQIFLVFLFVLILFLLAGLVVWLV